MAKGDQGGPLGNRPNRPHHKDGWHPERRSDEPKGKMPPRGQKPGYGEHNRSEKNK